MVSFRYSGIGIVGLSGESYPFARLGNERSACSSDTVYGSWSEGLVETYAGLNRGRSGGGEGSKGDDGDRELHFEDCSDWGDWVLWVWWICLSVCEAGLTVV